MTRSPVAKSWSLTLNNWTDEEYENVLSVVESDDVTYAVVAKEVGSQEGTPHLQMAVTFAKAKRRTAVLKLPGFARCWCEPTIDLAYWRSYCQKADKEAVIKNHKQGKRTDIDDAIEELQAGGITALVNNHASTYVRYSSGFERLAARYQTPRDPQNPPEVIWIFGSTGLGKSRFVHEAEPDIWVSLATHKWWDGYTQQAAILIDDMRCSWAPFSELLRILDRYPYRAEKKGGTIQVNSPRIYITTQFAPHVLYNPENRTGEDICQLLRRLTTVYEVCKEMPPQEGTTAIVRHGTFFVRKNQFDLLQKDSGAYAAGFNP